MTLLEAPRANGKMFTLTISSVIILIIGILGWICIQLYDLPNRYVSQLADAKRDARAFAVINSLKKADNDEEQRNLICFQSLQADINALEAEVREKERGKEDRIVQRLKALINSFHKLK